MYIHKIWTLENYMEMDEIMIGFFSPIAAYFPFSIVLTEFSVGLNSDVQLLCTRLLNVERWKSVTLLLEVKQPPKKFFFVRLHFIP